MTLWPVLVASLVGSPHCAAMCGLIAGGAGRGLGAQSAYHLGRLAGYLALGGLAGAAGLALNQAGRLIGFAAVATQIAGWLLVVAGVTTILATLGVRIGRPGRAHRWVIALAARIGDIPPRRRALALGLLTALLPCGWLLAFVAVAAGSGSPVAGAVSMAVFWLGTVPGLATAGALIQRASGPLRRRLPLISAAALIGLGVVTVMARPSSHLTHAPSPVVHESRGR